MRARRTHTKSSRVADREEEEKEEEVMVARQAVAN